MVTGGPIPMPTDADILTLAQWFSPAYPVGAFTYSHGLEAAVDLGQVGDGQGLRDWLADVLQHGGGFNDALFLAAAYRAENADALGEINATALAFAASKERAVETQRQGRAFGLVTGEIWQGAGGDLVYPVAVGRAAVLQGLPQDLTAKMYLQAFMSNLVAAAQRLFALGQTEGQKIIRDLAPLCQQVAGDTRSGELSQLSATAFRSDIAAMKHETQYARIFYT